MYLPRLQQRLEGYVFTGFYEVEGMCYCKWGVVYGEHGRDADAVMGQGKLKKR